MRGAPEVYQRKVGDRQLVVMGNDLIVAGTELSYRYASSHLAAIACATWSGEGEPPGSQGESPRCACCGRVFP